MRRTIAILAIALATGCTAASAQTTTTTPAPSVPAACDPPTGLHFDFEVGHSTARLNWTAAAAATGYEMRIPQWRDSVSELRGHRVSMQFARVGPGGSFSVDLRTVCGTERSEWTTGTAAQAVILGHWLVWLQESAATLWPADTHAARIAALETSVVELEHLGAFLTHHPVPIYVRRQTNEFSTSAPFAWQVVTPSDSGVTITLPVVPGYAWDDRTLTLAAGRIGRLSAEIRPIAGAGTEGKTFAFRAHIEGWGLSFDGHTLRAFHRDD